MSRPRPSRAPRPLDRQRLDALALRYVGRYATTRAKLIDYLRRKLRERGWDGDGEPDIAAIAQRFADLGYVDDRAFALAKASAHVSRGFGSRRLASALHAAGVEEEERGEAMALADSKLADSALRLAQRRRLGPYAGRALAGPQERDKAIAALIRGGHRFDIARAIIDLSPGDEAGIAEIRRRYSHTDE